MTGYMDKKWMPDVRVGKNLSSSSGAVLSGNGTKRIGFARVFDAERDLHL